MTFEPFEIKRTGFTNNPGVTVFKGVPEAFRIIELVHVVT
jgi:hypothetical protein